ncbi:glycosyltransferase family 2 protein [Virgibacillus litoralis]|uniref:Glycosyltransferase involved in cell wall biosynthesis n=1 Tax=Virgibacillus litoralis TaxID=578221 RepID=A0ABS4HDP8_9BACI|nr:glycosyltransferase [Virgibacillus litoralis]MBP1949047.1 glycosyltransferase involved in cell wall biosynthesis [Virgibacillus litoralis]
MPKVSFIVAAYNIENYIKKCIDSLMNQTLQDIEIIVVNDGSTDDTLLEIKETCKKDDRISIIDQKNAGVMRAREEGFKASSGEYVLFVDGDDWLTEDAAEVLYNKAEQSDYDIVCYNFIYTDGEKNKKNYTKQEYEKITGEKFLNMVMTNKIMPSLWSKLIKRKFIIEKDVTFPNGIAKAQDLAFSCSLGIHLPNACVVDEYLYFYFNSRINSVSNTISPLLLEVEKATSFVRKQLKEHNMLETHKEEFEYLAFTHNFNKDMIYINKNKFSKVLYKKWRSMRIDINKNKYFKELIKGEPFKAKVILKIVVRNYFLGSIFYNMYSLYTFIIKRPNTV